MFIFLRGYSKNSISAAVLNRAAYCSWITVAAAGVVYTTHYIYQYVAYNRTHIISLSLQILLYKSVIYIDSTHCTCSVAYIGTCSSYEAASFAIVKQSFFKGH
jgi:hypothetical protein